MKYELIDLLSQGEGGGGGQMEMLLSQINCQNQLSHPGLSHTEQECQENLIQGKIHYQQNLNEGLKYL